jgi:beta-lactamase class A
MSVVNASNLCDYMNMETSMNEQSEPSPKSGRVANPLFADRRAFLAGLGAAGALHMIASPAAWAVPSTPLELKALERRHGGRLGVCAQDDSRRVAWRSDERFAYCSTFKLFLAAATLERIQRGQERLDRAIPIHKSDMLAHAPTTQPAIGSTLTVEQLCKGTVELSDNPAANILIREMGGLDAWRSWYRAVGDSVTRVDRLETELNTAIPDDPRDTTTPAQTVANLDKVLLGSLLTPAHRSLLEGWLVNTPTGAGRIKAGVPAGYRVAHKTGTGAKASYNDIGMVWPSKGAPILIAVYFTGARDASPAQIEAVVAEATRASLRALGHG